MIRLKEWVSIVGHGSRQVLEFPESSPQAGRRRVSFPNPKYGNTAQGRGERIWDGTRRTEPLEWSMATGWRPQLGLGERNIRTACVLRTSDIGRGVCVRMALDLRFL